MKEITTNTPAVKVVNILVISKKSLGKLCFKKLRIGYEGV